MELYKHTVKFKCLVNHNNIHKFLTLCFEKPLVTTLKVTAFHSFYLEFVTNKKELNCHSIDFYSSHITENFIYHTYSKGDEVLLTGYFAYSKTLREPFFKNGRTIKSICPVRKDCFDKDVLHHFINNNLFISDYYVIEKSGIQIVKVNTKKHINNLFYLKVRGKVFNASAFNLLHFSSVGRSKSYGFGGVDIS